MNVSEMAMLKGGMVLMVLWEPQELRPWTRDLPWWDGQQGTAWTLSAGSRRALESPKPSQLCLQYQSTKLGQLSGFLKDIPSPNTFKHTWRPEPLSDSTAFEHITRGRLGTLRRVNTNHYVPGQTAEKITLLTLKFFDGEIIDEFEVAARGEAVAILLSDT